MLLLVRRFHDAIVSVCPPVGSAVRHSLRYPSEPLPNSRRSQPATVVASVVATVVASVVAMTVAKKVAKTVAKTVGTVVILVEKIIETMVEPMVAAMVETMVVEWMVAAMSIWMTVAMLVVKTVAKGVWKTVEVMTVVTGHASTVETVIAISFGPLDLRYVYTFLACLLRDHPGPLDLGGHRDLGGPHDLDDRRVPCDHGAHHFGPCDCPVCPLGCLDDLGCHVRRIGSLSPPDCPSEVRRHPRA